ncbi:MAG: CPBP family intramembrane glutamic endopeptidase [Candidatus Korarchaeum sp.]
MKRELISFLVTSFGLASLLDLIFYLHYQRMSQIEAQLYAILWGLARMYTPALGAVISLLLAGESVKQSMISYLNLGRKSMKYFFLSPLVVYSAVGFFFLLAFFLSLVDLDSFLDLIVKSSGGIITKEFARTLLILNILSSYPIALTINSLFALGEEIGWRGYLFRLLGWEFNLRNVLTIGSIWGLWHSTAIALMGHNYPVLRTSGVPLFMLFCITLSAPMLKLVRESESILPAVSLHGCLNALWGLTVYSTKMRGVENELYGGMGLLGISSLTISAIVVTALLRRSSRRAS